MRSLTESGNDTVVITGVTTNNKTDILRKNSMSLFYLQY